MSDDKFLYELREEMPVEFGKKLYNKLQRQEQQRSVWTLAAALLFALLGISLLLSRSSTSTLPDTAQASLNNLQPITSENVGQMQLLRTLGYGTAESVAWSPDGTTVAVAGSRGLFLHPANNWQAEPRQISDAWTQYPTYNTDGSVLSAVSENAIVMFNPATGQVLRRIELTDLRYYSLLYSADGTKLAIIACSSTDELVQRDLMPCTYKTVRLWDAISGEPLNSFEIGISTNIALNDDFTLIAWVDDAPRVRIRSTVTDESRILINGPLAAGSNAVAFYGDKLYALTPFDERFTVWETEGILDGTDVIQLSATTIPNYTGASNLFFLSETEVMVMVADVLNERLELRDTEGNTLRQFVYQSFQIRDFALSSDNTQLVAIFWDGTIATWDVTNGEMLALLQHYANQYTQLSFSTDHETLAGSNTYSSTLDLWDTSGETESRLHINPDQSETIVAFALNADGSQLAYALYPSYSAVAENNTPNSIWLYDVTTGEAQQVLETPRMQAGLNSALIFTDDGTLVAIVNQDILRLDATGASTHTLSEDYMPPTFYGFSSPVLSQDGTKFAAIVCTERSGDIGCVENAIRVWDTQSGELLYELVTGIEGTLKVGLTFSADGNIVAASQCDPQTQQRGNSTYYLCAGSTFILWDISDTPSTTPIEPFATISNAEQTQIVSSLMFSPVDEGETLLLFTWSSYDGVQMWSINRVTGDYTLLGSLVTNYPRWYTLPEISADGKLLAIGGPGIVELWGVPAS